MTEVIVTSNQLNNIIDNTFLGTCPSLDCSEIVFNGKGNVLFCEEGVHIVNSKISFNGNNSLVYLSKNKHEYIINVDIFNNSTLYFGRDNYINPGGRLSLVLSEEHNIVIGSKCLFSFGIWLRNADPHLVYSIETNERLNHTKSIYLGDHVWVGQSVMILKGSKIHSGSIIGAMSLVAGKEILSNESWGGNPIKRIASNIFWSPECVHKWTAIDTEKYGKMTSRQYVYKNSPSDYIDFDKIENEIAQITSALERSDYFRTLSENRGKNRFAKCYTKKKTITSRIKRKIYRWIR